MIKPQTQIKIIYIHKPVGLHTRTAQLGVSCQAASCEACKPSHKAGSQTPLESQKSQADCNLPGNLEDILTHGVVWLACKYGSYSVNFYQSRNTSVKQSPSHSWHF